VAIKRFEWSLYALVIIALLYLALQMGRFWGHREYIRKESQCFRCHYGVIVYQSRGEALASYEALKMHGVKVVWEVK